MGWHCIKLHLPRRAGGIGFQNMLFKELSELRENRPGCHVFRKSFTDGRDWYYFSPQASELLEGFIAAWDGIPVQEPTDLVQGEKLA